MIEGDSTRSELGGSLHELAAFMRERGEHWADPIDAAGRDVDAGDPGGASRFLQLFGGMGSLNDVVFHPMNGNANEAEDLDAINTRFELLRSRAWKLATKVVTAQRRA